MTRNEADKSLDVELRNLVMQTRQGDQIAYKKLLTGTAPIVRRMVSARIGRSGQQHYVEDITQDTLLAIHLKLHTYDAHMPFLAWVHAVARHKLIDHFRCIKGATFSLDDETMPELVDSANPEEASIVLDLQKLLGQLKPPAGEIIRALKVEGTSVKDIAATHKLSEANVKVIVHRGLQKLAQIVRSV
jgi:RNA polymerase sigma-70 factor (ECF subfamily)